MDVSFKVVHFLYFSVFIYPVFSKHSSIACQESCICTTENNGGSTKLSCKWPHIPSSTREIFKLHGLPPGTILTSLDFECDGNGISKLPKDMFVQHDKLLHLRIENCDIRELSPNLFRNLKYLTSLHLVNNRLPNSTLKLDDNFFDNFSRLEMLHIVGFQLNNFPKKSLCNVKRLKVLNLSSNRLPSIGAVFDSKKCFFRELMIVNLSSNNITSIGRNDFSSVGAALELHLNDNQVEHVDDDSFTSLLKLLDLNLAGNKLRWIPRSVSNLALLTSLNLSSNNLNESIPWSLGSVELQSLDLNQNNFTVFPESFLQNVLPNLRFLSFAHNNIKEFPKGAFSSAGNLRKLDLSHNSIAELTNVTFNSTNLNYLNLSYNRIDDIEPEFILGSSSLLDLDLSHNRFHDIPSVIRKFIILESLNVSHNKLPHVRPTLFKDLAALQFLDLSHNLISEHDRSAFRDARQLTTLNLSHNWITKFGTDAFANCGKLKFLDLSFNRIANTSRSLVNVSSLVAVNLSHNWLSKLQWTDFPEQLTNLDVSDNQISVLAVSTKSQLEEVKLERNLLETLESSWIPSSVKYLGLASNRIKQIHNSTFTGKMDLSVVDLRDNKIANISKDVFHIQRPSGPILYYFAGNPLKCTCDMDWMFLPSREKILNIVDLDDAKCYDVYEKQHIALSKVESGKLMCPYRKHCSQNCMCCDYSSCDCLSVCPPGCHCYHNSSDTKNVVQCVGETLNTDNLGKMIPNTATHLYLESVRLRTINVSLFLPFKKLQQLRINGSSIQKIGDLTFKYLHSLEFLDLSNNELTNLTGEEFAENGTKITCLYLNNNRLQTVSPKLFKKLPKLQLLTLHDNELEDLPEAFEFYGQKISKVTLARNSFSCDCNNGVRIQSWLSESLDKVMDASNINCSVNLTNSIYSNGITFLSGRYPIHETGSIEMGMLEFIKQANSTICVPETNRIFDASNPTNYIWIAAAVLVLVCATVGYFVFGRSILRKTRATFSQRRYKCPPSLNCSELTPGSSPVPLIHFDAFVSYAKKDEKLIIDLLCRQLECQEYLLCLLHRDGPAHTNKLHLVSDELISQMECSNALILVLTQNFLDGEWKTLQIKTSHRLFAKSRGKKLIALIGDEIAPNQLDAELGQILRKNTCIKMSDPMFWNLLRSALPERITPSSYSGDSSQIYSDCYGTIVPSDVV